MPYKDKEQQKEFHKQWYQDHKEESKIRRRLNSRKHRIIKKKFVRRFIIFKGCKVCGYKKCSRALDFHHIDPATKVANVSQIVNQHYSIKVLKKEIRKCIVLCCRCHRELDDGIIKL